MNNKKINDKNGCGMINVINICYKTYYREIIFITALLAIYLQVIFFFSEDASSFTAIKAKETSTVLFDIILFYAGFILVREAKIYKKGTLVLLITVYVCIVILHFKWQFMFADIEINWNNKNLFFVQVLFLLSVCCYFARRVIKEDNASYKLRYDYGLILLVGCPLITYAIINFDYFSEYQIITYFIFFISLPLISILIIRFIEQKYLSTRIMVPLVLTLFFVYYSMPMYSGAIKKTADSNIYSHILILFVISVFVVFLYVKEKNLLLILVGLLLLLSVSNGVFSIQSGLLNVNIEIDSNIDKPIQKYISKSFKKKPDIYLLIYDSYVGRKLLNQYDINNDEQMQFLKTKGFQLYEEAYTISALSLPSLAKVLDMSLGGKNKPEARALVAGQSTVNKLLQKQGYKTHYVLSPIMRLNQPMWGNYSYPSVDKSKSFGADIIWRGIARGEFKYNLVYSQYSYETMVKEKRAVITKDSEYPKFLYSHSKYPGHSQNSGVCLPNEIQLFSERLRKAKLEMREDIDAILSSDRDSIIIVAGDHGPYLRGSCVILNHYEKKYVTALELADRFGALVAIKWPETKAVAKQELTVLQDIFFLVFAYLFEDKAILKQKLYPKATSYFGGNYDFFLIDNNIVVAGKDKGKKMYEAILDYPKLAD